MTVARLRGRSDRSSVATPITTISRAPSVNRTDGEAAGRPVLRSVRLVTMRAPVASMRAIVSARSVELRLVISEVDDGRGALRQRREHREIHGAATAACDDVALFEYIAIEQNQRGQTRMFDREPIYRRHDLCGALVGGVLVADDDQQCLRPVGTRRRPKRKNQEKADGESAHLPMIVTQ